MLASDLELGGENRRLMNLVMRESDRLDHIIADFLEFARLRPPRKRIVSITNCLEEVIVLLSNNVDKSGDVEIEFLNHADEVQVNVDDEQLRQVFTNLSVNSCEAMHGEGRLRILVGQEEPGWLTITFRDEGPGIEDDDVERLFEPFFTTKDGGTGLGLAIANRIVAAHGGTISFRNRPGGGAEFAVALPVGKEKDKNADTAAPRAGDDELKQVTRTAG
jgi:two-component system sensor histidine kinase PilS (NtrC family)